MGEDMTPSNVILDYGERLLKGINSTKDVISNILNGLIGVSDISCIESSNRLKVIEETTIEGSKTLTVFNQLAHPIREVICLKTSTLLKVTLLSSPNTKVSQQIGPFFGLKDKKLTQFGDKYELCFTANIDGLTLETYKLDAAQDGDVPENEIIKPNRRKKAFQIEIENEYILANFESKSGFLQSVTNKETAIEHKTQIQFISYGARPRGTKKTTGSDSVSGAYLFLPDGKAKKLKSRVDDIVIVKGPVRSSVYIHIADEYSLLQRISLNWNEDVLRINNLLDISSATKNIEIGMQIQADSNLNQFYTDLNGFELTRRRKYDSLPLHAQFYPMPSAAILQNDNIRLSLLSRQPHGVGNIFNGKIQVMLDRRLDQNDDRGDLNPLTDNMPTESEFILLIESFHEAQQNSNNTIAYHSLKAHHNVLKMNNYPVTTISAEQPKLVKKSFLSKSLPCDIHLLALRTSTSATNFDDKSFLAVFPLNSTALILQKLGWEHSFGISKYCFNLPSAIKPGRLFNIEPKCVSNVSLTMFYDYGEIDLNREISLTPMQLTTFRLDY